MTNFILSAFGDEIADDLDTQLLVLKSLRIPYLELRGVWGKNVLDLSDAEARAVRETCAANGIAVRCIGSPVGKSSIEEPEAMELDKLRRIFAVAEMAGTRLVRLFSYYPPTGSSSSESDYYLDEAVGRLRTCAALAEEEGFNLLLENEKELVGDTAARCAALLEAVASPRLRFVWDPANFVQVGEAQVIERAWNVLGSYTDTVHVKDARLTNGEVTVAGAGEGQVRELLARLAASERPICLALEPHLAFAGSRGGFSGPEGMAVAAQALRGLLQEIAVNG